MTDRTLELIALHRELCDSAVSTLVRGNVEGWSSYRAAMLIESTVDQKLSRFLRNRRLQTVHPRSTIDRNRSGLYRLGEDLVMLDMQTESSRLPIAA